MENENTDRTLQIALGSYDRKELRVQKNYIPVSYTHLAIGVPVAVGVFFGGNTVDNQITAVVAVQAADDVQQGGLAGTAGAENGNKFIVPQVQADVCLLYTSWGFRQ